MRPRNKFYEFIWSILRPIFSLLHPLRVEGLENVPQEGPVLLCPNHSSAIDPILLVIALGRRYPIRIMAKQQLLKIPVLGAILRGIGVFPVDRGNSDIGAVKTAIRSLKDGWNLLLFPEGTRVREPGTVAVKGGAAMIAIRSGVQMLPVFIGRQKQVFSRVPIIFGKPYAPGVHRAQGHGGGDTRRMPRRSCVRPTQLGGGRSEESFRQRARASATVCSARWIWRSRPRVESGGCCDAGRASSTTRTWCGTWSSWAAHQVTGPEEIRPGDTVLIRAHGEHKAGHWPPGGQSAPSAWTPRVRTCCACSKSVAQADAGGPRTDHHR